MWWNSRTSGEKLVTCIVALNIGVSALWRVVPLQGMMLKYFISIPVGGAPCRSMFLSTFSHYSALHLFLNMYVLMSFAPVAGQLFGREQFLAMYITAGMVSSFTSYAMKIAHHSLLPSLGASGAIMGLLGAVCISYPNSRLSIAFVNQIIPHSFSAGTGMACIILLDVAGVILGWRFFDHAAHLGGMLFGIWYVKYGNKLIWQNRKSFMEKWHTLRGKP